MKKSVLYFIFGIVSLWIFWEFSKIVAISGYLKQLDFDLTVKLQNNVPEKFDVIINYFITVAGMEISSVLLVLILLLQRKRRGVLVLGFYILGLGLVLWGKTFVPHAPPTFMFHRLNQDLPFSPYFAANENSYPSGHTYRIVFLFLVICSAVRRYQIKFGMTIITGVIMLGLVVLGHHWTSDVIGAVLIVISMTLFSRMLY